MYTKSSKSFKGSVSVESFQGRLRLRLPRQLFDGKQKYLTLGLPDTDLNRRTAQAKAKLIESDIALERFDYTLAKYGKPQSPQLTVVEALKPQVITVVALWERFAADKQSSLKPKTLSGAENS